MHVLVVHQTALIEQLLLVVSIIKVDDCGLLSLGDSQVYSTLTRVRFES